MFRTLLAICISIACLPLSGQLPFTCQGDYFMALAPSGSSTVYKVEIDPFTTNVVFNPLPSGEVGFILNSVGYRSTDNFIYGINDTSEELYRIDADGKAYFLTLLSGIDHGLFYPAGDVSPDGRYLVLIGGLQGGGNSAQVMVLVDLESPDFTTTVVNIPANNSTIYDIAFDPTDGQLYGYDSNLSRVVIIDFATGNISTPFPSGAGAQTVGSVFFDAFGDLYCYGSLPSGSSQTTLFKINKHTGTATPIASGPVAPRTDGCSCPYNIEMTKTVEPVVVVPCTEATYTFQIANSSGHVQSDLTFQDILPPGFIVTAIQNSFGGTVVSGIGTNMVLIEGMSIPLGLHQLTVTVMIPQNGAGFYKNQATLSGLPSLLGSVVVSDNPLTIVQNDSTSIEVIPLEIDFSEVQKAICSGDEILLAPSIPGVSYLWSDGSTEETFVITKGGVYSVTVTSGCDQLIETITVQEIEPAVIIDSIQQINLGESIELRPVPIGIPPYIWSWSGKQGEMGCKNCQYPIVNSLFDGIYDVTMTDATGCPAYGTTKIIVLKNRNVYVPNAFSPNGDGLNDFFYPQSPQASLLRNFKIFSRWGELVFETENAQPNDPFAGWNGDFDGKPAHIGVYVWLLGVEFLDGETVFLKGDVTVVR